MLIETVLQAAAITFYIALGNTNTVRRGERKRVESNTSLGRRNLWMIRVCLKL
jgi:hypothetical protein